MIGGVLAVAALDLLRWWRSPRAMAAALIPPLGMALLLAVLTISVTRQPVALVVEAHGPAADAMARIVESDTEAYALRVVDAGTAVALLRDQEVAGVIVIPPGFDIAVRAHEATLDLTLNNVDIDFADDIRRAVARSVAQFDAPQLGIQGEITGAGGDLTLPNPYRVAIDERTLRTTTVSFLSYQVLPALILLLLDVGLMGTASLCGRDRETATSRHLLLSPLPAWALIAGRLLGGTLASLAVLVPVLVLGVVTRVLDPPVDHWPALALLFVVTALAAAGLGAVLGAWLRGAAVIAMASSVVATYLFFLGGGFTTIAFLPPWLQTVSDFVPARYAIDGLRQCLFYPDLRGVWTDLAVLFGTALFACVVGAVAVRRSWGLP